MKTALHPLLGHTEPDPMGQLLGTGFLRFSSPSGIDGLCLMPEPGELQLLAVAATEPGTGQFRSFIHGATALFSTVIVWHIENDALRAYLVRLGFEPYVDVSNAGDGEILHGLRWTRNTTDRQR